MFNFISEKIKTLAKALTIIGCIISILYGILSIPSNPIAAVLIAGLAVSFRGHLLSLYTDLVN